MKNKDIKTLADEILSMLEKKRPTPAEEREFWDKFQLDHPEIDRNETKRKVSLWLRRQRGKIK
jgi:hypothetical protein